MPRPCPSGFKPHNWATFKRDGILVVENALSAPEVEALLSAIAAFKKLFPRSEDGFFCEANIVEADAAFAALIDHPRHIGFMHDLYGDMLKLQLSEIFVRPARVRHQAPWHIDGPRITPFSSFSPEMPLQVRIGYWLTDIPDPDMANLVYLPGSQHRPYLDEYSTDQPVMGEVQLRVPRGAMTIQHCGLWHRTAPNKSDVDRINIYLGYCPSWIPTADRFSSNPVWLKGLNREQRILMRSYDHAYHHAKIPPADVPLFLPRANETDEDWKRYSDKVAPENRKRTLWWERRRQR